MRVYVVWVWVWVAGGEGGDNGNGASETEPWRSGNFGRLDRVCLSVFGVQWGHVMMAEMVRIFGECQVLLGGVCDAFRSLVSMSRSCVRA